MRQPPRKVFRKLSAVAAAATAGLLGNHFHGLAAADDRAVIAPAALRHLKLDTALPAYKLVSRFDRLHFIPFLSFETESVSVNDLFLSRFPGKTYCIRKGNAWRPLPVIFAWNRTGSVFYGLTSMRLSPSPRGYSRVPCPPGR